MIVTGAEAASLVSAIRNEIIDEIELAFTNEINIKHRGNYWSVLNCAAYYGKVSIVTLLLKNVKLIKETDLDDSLHIAAENGHTSVVELLLKHGANIDSMNARYHTPLFLAVDYCNTDVVSLLLRMGADTSVTNDFQDTLLHCAVRKNSKEITFLLLNNGANKEMRNKDGMTPLLIAVKYNYEDILNILIEAGANLKACDNFDNTSLHMACEEGFLSIVKLLLDEGADINLQNATGWTPLWYATYYNRECVVKLLLDRGADITITDNSRNTVLHICVKNRCKFLTALLLQSGADVNSRNINGSDIFDLTKTDVSKIKFLIRLILYLNINTPIPERHNRGDFLKFWDACKSELEQMEKCKIAESNLSYRQLLLERNKNKLIGYLHNANIVSELDTLDYKKKFPIYQRYFTENINKGKFMLRLYYKADEVVKHIIPDMPIEVWRIIYNYLSYDDLAKLIGWNDKKLSREYFASFGFNENQCYDSATPILYLY